jgi:hypothetical protein
MNDTTAKITNLEERIKQLENENRKLKNGGSPVQVPGSIRGKVKTDFGKFKTVNIKIKNGFPFIPAAAFDLNFKDRRTVVSTIALMKKVTGEELTDSEKESFPFLLDWSVESIKKSLIKLYEKGSGYIEELK